MSEDAKTREAAVAKLLNAIAVLFDEPRITLLVRQTGGNMLVSNDVPGDILAALESAWSQEGDHD
jgi:hypothetical protein